MAAPPIQQGMKCSGSLITCRLPVSLGSSFKSLLDIRKQALALPVKHLQLPGATDHTTPFYCCFTHSWWNLFLLMHQNHPSESPNHHPPCPAPCGHSLLGLCLAPRGSHAHARGSQHWVHPSRQSWEHILCLRAGGKGPGGGTKQPCPARAAAGSACVPAGGG